MDASAKMPAATGMHVYTQIRQIRRFVQPYSGNSFWKTASTSRTNIISKSNRSKGSTCGVFLFCRFLLLFLVNVFRYNTRHTQNIFIDPLSTNGFSVNFQASKQLDLTPMPYLSIWPQPFKLYPGFLT